MDQLHAVLLGLLLAGPASAASARMVWLCDLPGDGTRLVCIADIDPADERPQADDIRRPPPEGDEQSGKATFAQEPASPAGATTAVVNGTRFPLDAARVYMVDLWSPPTDADFVRLLARATICYRSPGCQVMVAPGPWLAAR